MDSNSVNGTNDSRPGMGQLVLATKGLPAPLNPYGPLAGYGASPADEPGLFGLGLLDYWRIVVKRKWLILGIVAAFVLLSSVRTLMQTPLYTATVRLQIDRNVPKMLDTGNVSPVEDDWDDDFMRTQYQIIQSRSMAERVASALDLGNDPDFFAPRNFSVTGAIMGLLRPTSPPAQKPVDEGALKAAAVGVILGNRTVSPVIRLSLSRYQLFRSESRTGAKNRKCLCRCLPCFHARHAVPSQRIGKNISRRQDSAIKAPSGGVGKKASGVRPAAANHGR